VRQQASKMRIEEEEALCFVSPTVGLL